MASSSSTAILKTEQQLKPLSLASAVPVKKIKKRGRKTKVLIADDHHLVRQALRTVLEMEKDLTIVGEAKDGREAIEMVRQLCPDVILLDLRMPNVHGVAACVEMKKANPQVRVIVLTGFDDDSEIFEALEAGATSYLLKDILPDELIWTIHMSIQGHTILAPTIMDKVVGKHLSKESVEQKYLVDPLSSREVEVLQLMAKGYRNKQIAQALWISETTVKTHISHILQKLNQPNRTRAVLYALDKGLVLPNHPSKV